MTVLNGSQRAKQIGTRTSSLDSPALFTSFTAVSAPRPGMLPHVDGMNYRLPFNPRALIMQGTFR